MPYRWKTESCHYTSFVVIDGTAVLKPYGVNSDDKFGIVAFLGFPLCTRKYCLRKWWPFCPGGDGLNPLVPNHDEVRILCVSRDAIITLCLLTHWGGDKMAAIFQTTLSNAFSWMKMFEFRLRFHWILFPGVQLTILVQIMAWRRSGDKPLSEPMMVCLLTHICVTRSHWVDMLLWCMCQLNSNVVDNLYRHTCPIDYLHIHLLSIKLSGSIIYLTIYRQGTR